MSFIDLHTNVSLGHTKMVGLGGEKLWLCPTLGGDKLDISGNGNHGIYYGGMGTVADTSNGGTRAYLLDGSNTQRIECPASAIGSEPIISVSCWGYVNVHDSSFGEGLVSQFGAGTNSSTCKFTVNASNGGSSSIFPAVGIRPSTTNVLAVSTSAISAQSWHHFCLVADGSTIYNYVDGVLQASTAYTGSVRSVTNPFVIGTYNQLINSNHYLNGRIDDVRAFDRALSTSEITHLASKRGVLGTPRNPVIKKRRIFYAPTAPPTTTAKAVVLKKPKPSYATGYARNASESANPNLWKGLVGAWMPSFGVTGNTLKDVSGNGNDGTLTNMDAASDWVATSKGLALDFDGVNDYVRFNRPKQIVNGGAISISIWVKWITTGSSVSDIQILVDNFHSSTGFAIQDRPDLSKRLSFYIARNPFGLLSTGQIGDGSWKHVVCTNDRVYSRLYVNGVLDNYMVDSGGINQVNPLMNIGSFQNGGRYLNGDVSNLSIYSRALSPTEIKQLYLNPLAPFERKQQTVGLSTAAVAPSANFNPFSVLTHPLEQ